MTAAPLEIRQLQARLREAEIKRLEATKEEAYLRSHIAAVAVDKYGMTMREAAPILGVSHQRVQQLVKKANQMTRSET